MDARGSFWWTKVAGPRRLVDVTVSTLIEKRYVAIIVPGDVPWRHEMRHAVMTSFRQAQLMPNVSFREIDVEDLAGKGSDPATVLIGKLGKRADVLAWRSGTAEQAAGYMDSRGILRSTLVWVKGVPLGDVAKWIELACAVGRSQEGAMVVECRGGVGGPGKRGAKVEYLRHVRMYDAKLMCSATAAEECDESMPVKWIEYVSAVAAEMSPTDPEVACDIVSEMLQGETDPISAAQQLSSSQRFAMRGASDPEHVLSLCRSGQTKELEKRLWRAQLSTLFPLVEAERLQFVSSREKVLAELIDDERNGVKGELEAPEDVELGTIQWMIRSGLLQNVADEERSRLSLLREVRNKLAHRDTVDHFDARRITGYY